MLTNKNFIFMLLTTYYTLPPDPKLLPNSVQYSQYQEGSKKSAWCFVKCIWIFFCLLIQGYYRKDCALASAYASHFPPDTKLLFGNSIWAFLQSAFKNAYYFLNQSHYPEGSKKSARQNTFPPSDPRLLPDSPWYSCKVHLNSF